MVVSLHSGGTPHRAAGTGRPKPLAALCLLFALAAGLYGSCPAVAQDELKIAAVVNDDVITQLDVFTRLRLAMFSARLQDTPEVRQQLLPTVMRALIDDHLKSQEAKAQGVTAGERDVNGRIESLASRSNMSREDFETMLTSNGIMVSALEDQIRAEIGWGYLVRTKLRPTIRITDAEIDEAQARAKSAKGKEEYRLSVIFQAVNSAKEASAVQQSAQQLLEQLQGGADFASLAQGFSQDSSAGNGGDIGWVRIDQADPAIAKELAQVGNDPAAKGRVLGPIAGTGGYYLVRVEDLRQTDASPLAPGTIHMVRLFWPLPTNVSEKEVTAAKQQAEGFKNKSQSCEEFERLADDASTARFQDMGRVPVESLPADVQNLVINLPVGQSSEPLLGSGGLGVIMVCDRGGSASRAAFADRLAAERLETLARGYLSDLHRSAYIDIRL